MNAIQKRCRPKHQVLVLKCYPRTIKGAVDVKPNSSELSYLLFYATSRRSKIQKIGAFLEKKTASDVWRMRIGNVQVTLGILAALVEKSPRDMALIAPCILKILDLILRSNDITMVESSLPTFQALCDHFDASSLFADHAYLSQYQSIVRCYAQLASPRHFGDDKPPVSRPLQMRWRHAGLDAIKCVASSDALSSISGRQIDLIIPVILENMWSHDDSFLHTLLQRVEADDKPDADKPPLRPRPSLATVHTAETAPGDTNPLALSGTALDVDKLDEEDMGVLATQCLKSIFVSPNRSQIHAATVALLRFITQHCRSPTSSAAQNTDGAAVGVNADWAIHMFEIIARWAPVQDRYIILQAALDTMVKTPMREDSLGSHRLLTAMMRSLLRSEINLIGLSVMDVLVGLVKQTKKLFRLPCGSRLGRGRAVDGDEESATPSEACDLLDRLEKCIGDLATHVYYADQISDMVAALVARLEPSRNPSSSPKRPGDKLVDATSPTAAAANTTAAMTEPPGRTLSAADLTRGTSPSPLEARTCHNNGRISALRVIKAILLVANPRTNNSVSMTLARNRVPMATWEGTQRLLMDPDRQVRKAYIEALEAWLDRETTPADSRARSDVVVVTAAARSSVSQTRELPSSRRAVSAASSRERQPQARRSRFLSLLHLAIYDAALELVDWDNDMVLLHGLLAKLVLKLGVNAARFGVAMVYRLQEEVQDLEQPMHKVRIAALCHGYFLALVDRFDFEASAPGRAILNEVARRRSKGFWVEGIRIPPPSACHVGPAGQSKPHPDWDLSLLEREELLPFDDRASLVDCIAANYRESNLSPPASPGASTGRTRSSPMTASAAAVEASGSGPSQELPSSFRESMLGGWSREAVLLSLIDGRTESLNGSRSGTTGTNANRLAVNAGSPLAASPYGSMRNLRPPSPRGQAERPSSLSQLRKASLRSLVSPSASASSKPGIATVEQLKRALSGSASPRMVSVAGTEDGDGEGGEDGEEQEGDGEESMASWDLSLSEEGSLSPKARAPSATVNGADSEALAALGGGTTTTTAAQEVEEVGKEAAAAAAAEAPKLSISRWPSTGGNGRGERAGGGEEASKTVGRKCSVQGGGGSSRTRSLRSRDEGGRSSSGRGLDLQELLRGIDSRSGEGSLGNLTKPPY